MGYHRAGFEVVGVDINPQPNYPFEFHRLDAMTLAPQSSHRCWHPGKRTNSADCLGAFDVIHASPPCQHYSTATGKSRQHLYPDLVGRVRELLISAGVPYVIENVPGSPLSTTFVLCGSMFGLRVRRHRLFESSFLVMPPRCAHKTQGEPVGVYGMGGAYRERASGGSRGNKAAPAQYAELMEMPWAEPSEIRLAIPPAYTEYIGTQLLQHLGQPLSSPVKEDL